MFMRCDLFLLENKSATTTETTVTTVLQRTRTTLCSGILRGPSGGGVEPAEANKRGGRSWSRSKSGGEEERKSSRAPDERAFPRPGHLVLLERSSQGACLAGHGRRRPYPPHHEGELERRQSPQEPQGSPAGVQVRLASRRTESV